MLRNRILFSFLVFCFLFLVVTVKAFYIQVINQKKLVAYAKSQFIREHKEYTTRGIIYDRNHHPLAVNVQTHSVYTIPDLKNPEYKNEIKRLSKIIPEVNFAKIWKEVRKRNRYTWVKRNISLTDKQIFLINRLEDVYLEENSTRYYPNNELGSQVMGFVGIDNSGLSGVEAVFDKKLRGAQQITRYYRDAKGRPVRYEAYDNENAAQDLHLSIDKEIQGVLEEYLKDAVEFHQARSGGAGVMNAETGEILAMANYPTYDPNHVKDSRAANRKMGFVTDAFEPGSILKTMTIASAVENKTADREKKYYCEKGRLKVQNHYISEADTNKKFEWLTVEEILEHSSNVGTTKIAFDLGYNKLKQTLLDFGFGERTGVPLLGESRGIVNPDDDVSQLTLSNISFGHGIATTGIQMLQAYSVIANGGYLIKPRIVKIQPGERIDKKRIISAETSRSLAEMLINVVEKGTGKDARIPHYQIAGKTGTAQRVSPEGGYKGYIASFAGFPVNVSQPFVVMVYVDDPKENGYYGSQVALPIFKKITQYVLYKKKDFTRYAKYNEASNTRNLDQINVIQSSRKKELPGHLPNFVGLDKGAALKLAKKLSLTLEMTGYGIVKQQTPEPGTNLKAMDSLTLKFEPPQYDQ